MHNSIIKETGIQIMFGLFLLATVSSVFGQDNDRDGIPDAVEKQLLQKFSPFYMFSNDGGDDNFKPVDAWWYITQSEMLLSGDENQSGCITNQVLFNNPGALLFDDRTVCARYHSSDITKNPAKTPYHINPMNNVQGHGGDPGRRGYEWNVVLSTKRTGLYGHVVPVRLSNPYAYDFNTTYDGRSQGQLYYKIEYWQLFGYNSAGKSFDIGDHEGDWTSVQIIYDPRTNSIASVFHFAHGVLFRYDMTPQNTAGVSLLRIPEGMVKQFNGINFSNQNLDLSYLKLGGVPPEIAMHEDQVAKAQNNVVRFFPDPITKEFSHPVVYIEHGTHEFFPTENWSYYGAPNHNGQSYHYLAATPPNLGEAEFPLGEDRATAIIMHFNGYWGAYGKYNDPPQGPILHKSWQWPMGSSIRWQIHDQLGF